MMALRTTIARTLVWLGIIDKPAFSVSSARDMPGREELNSGEIVIVGPLERPKWLTFPCPSGCGEPLLLSLNKERRPRWSIQCDWLGRPSISPSVHRTDGCRCHFWLRKGRVEWCKDSGGRLPEN